MPSFFCVGAQKAGTTTLHDILRQHPEICLPTIKETKFFQSQEYEKGLQYYERAFFSKCGSAALAGEIDPDYMYFDHVAKRIFDSFGPGMKLLFLLRDPIERAYSHYWMTYRRGLETLCFEEALKRENRRLEEGGDFEKLHFSYIDRGRYLKQILNFMRFFQRENMKFVLFEEFRQNKKNVIDSVLNFLGVSTEVEVDLNIRSNPRSVPRSARLRDFLNRKNGNIVRRMGRYLIPVRSVRRVMMREMDRLNQRPVPISSCPQELRQRLLSEFFLEEITELERLVDLDLSSWKR